MLDIRLLDDSGSAWGGKCLTLFQVDKDTIYLLVSARMYLQPHYGNVVFGNVYLSAGQH
jgi:hypothetical protein